MVGHYCSGVTNLGMVRGKSSRCIRIVQGEVIVREEVLHTLQVRKPRSTSRGAASAYQSLILRQSLDLKQEKYISSDEKSQTDSDI